ncbi:MAG TPA: XTP/dITP diphosphatase [Pseudogracilibacillus sp.]|nr:XTP/dITP diphosphatase [Pseudogracilibacillus sp.]
MKKIIIASGNKGKIAEFKALFEKENIKILSLADLPVEIPEIEETGVTFHENAQIKAETVAKTLNLPVIADDSGLVVDALDGEPGVYSARYAGEPVNDHNNNEKLLNAMNHLKESERSARFVAVLALARPGEKTIYFEGHCEGKIALQAAGEFGFGYDPIFIPKGYSKTMAQLPQEEKNSISHRYHALQEVNKWLQSNEVL